MKLFFPTILLLIFVLGDTKSASGQITGDYIADKIASDTNQSSENYKQYGHKLALTLSKLSSEALARVFQQPVAVQVEGTLNEHLEMGAVNFGSGSPELTPDAKTELDKVVEFLQENPTANILVEGHTQFQNNQSQSLSENRAESASNYLQSMGIPASRIETIGYGATQPLIESGNKDETAPNRRIEIYVQ